MSLEPNFLKFYDQLSPLFEKLGLNLSTTKFIILQNCFFTLFPLTSPTQYRKPKRKSLFRKAENNKKPSKFYFENSWNFMPFSLFSYNYSSSFILSHPQKHNSFLPTWAFCSPVLFSIFPIFQR